MRFATLLLLYPIFDHAIFAYSDYIRLVILADVAYFNSGIFIRDSKFINFLLSINALLIT